MRQRLCLFVLAVLLVFPFLANAYDIDLEDIIERIPADIALAGGETTSEDIVRIGESIVVADGDTVEGDVVSIGGTVTIRGCVRGDAVAVGGSLILEAPGEVKGDAVAVGGGIEKGEGTKIGGDSVEVGLGPLKFIQPLIGLRGGPKLYRIAAASSPIRRVASVIVLLVITVLVVLFLPAPTERVSNTVQSHLPRSLLFGLIGEIAVVPLCVILAVSIVGIPLIPVALIGIAAACVFGMTGMSLMVGQVFFKRARARASSYVAAVAIGIILIELLSLLGAFVSPVLAVLGGILTFVGLLVLFFAWTTGFGAVILTRFGTREWAPRQAVVPSVEKLQDTGGEEEVQ